MTAGASTPGAPALFISDLHLAPEREGALAAFHAFARGPAQAASAVYVMGDLFDAWLGDDQRDEPFAQKVLTSLRSVSDAGVPLFVARGNRDFLLGEAFAGAAGATLLGEQTVVDLGGTPTLVTHGDEFCTDDTQYQRYRTWSRDPRLQRGLLRLPYRARRAIASWLRRESRAATSRKPDAILDVNAVAVEQAFRRFGVLRIIHGHTHRPARHSSVVDGTPRERIVLADWHDHGSFLEVDARGARSHEIAG
ncbi:MAG TPA: UDP-2,3-diacylglucosamine diphosphatase [Casimicrobiaceae bacterium]|nr:UDP-2,3-diacylglucosamine diphosphatase [Casimicrobiaceae bacterium]